MNNNNMNSNEELYSCKVTPTTIVFRFTMGGQWSKASKKEIPRKKDGYSISIGTSRNPTDDDKNISLQKATDVMNSIVNMFSYYLDSKGLYRDFEKFMNDNPPDKRN